VQKKETLQKIISNPASSGAERQEAQAAIRELESLDDGPTSLALNHLVQQLLRDARVSTLGEVPHHTVHQFLAELGIATLDADSLYQRWLHESPVAQRKLKQMEVHLANCFFDQQEALAARLQSATALGLDVSVIRKEMKKLYQGWVDSSIFNKHPEIRQMMRDVIANKL